MQHPYSDELVQVWRDLWATMSPEERLQVYPVQRRLRDLAGCLEQLVQGVSPEELERFQQLLQNQAEAIDART